MLNHLFLFFCFFLRVPFMHWFRLPNFIWQWLAKLYFRTLHWVQTLFKQTLASSTIISFSYASCWVQFDLLKFFKTFSVPDISDLRSTAHNVRLAVEWNFLLQAKVSPLLRRRSRETFLFILISQIYTFIQHFINTSVVLVCTTHGLPEHLIYFVLITSFSILIGAFWLAGYISLYVHSQRKNLTLFRWR